MTGIEEAVIEYLGALGAERGLATNTRAAYMRDLRQYGSVLEERGRDRVSDITGDDVSAFVKALHGRGLAPATIARKVAAVRGLHRFLAIEGRSGHDPTVLIDSPVRGRPLPRALTIDQVLALLEAPDRDTPLGCRDVALLEFLYASGARVSEAVSLEMDDLDLDEASALVTGKGSRQRIVPLGVPAVQALAAYFPVRLELKGKRRDPGNVFLNGRGGPLTRQGMFRIVKTQAERAGIRASRVSPHILRHSAATHMVERGADLRSVQEILGHANITTTQVYTRVTPQHLYDVYFESHPRSGRTASR